MRSTLLILLLGLSFSLFAQQGNGFVLHRIGKTKQVYYDQGASFRVIAQKAVFTADFYRITEEDMYFTAGNDTLKVPIRDIFVLRANRGAFGDIAGSAIVASGLAVMAYGALESYGSGLEVFNSASEGEVNQPALNDLQDASIFFTVGLAVGGFGSKVFGTKYAIGRKWAIRRP